MFCVSLRLIGFNSQKDYKPQRHVEVHKHNAAMNINDITYAIRGAVFEVNRVLGPGFLEKVYENALMIEFRQRGLEAESQVPIKVNYKDNMVGDYIADILVEGKVIVELKTVEKLEKLHEAQLLNYLKATGIQIGFLVNMKLQKVEIKRLVLNLADSDEC